MDSIKKMQQINSVNEGLFDNIFKKKQNNDLMQLVRGGGYVLNGNFIRSLNIVQSPLFNPMSNETWASQEYSWLTDAHFEAEYILVKQNKIYFSGIWKDGDFRGHKFFGDNSQFNGGNFFGEVYDAPNMSFNVDGKISPENYIKGSFIDNKNGILGTKNLESTGSSNEKFGIIQIPIGWGVELTDLYGSKVSFQVLKRLDEKDTSFMFLLLPERRRIIIPWETIRSNYFKKALISYNKKFELFDGREINEIRNIKIFTEPPMSISTSHLRLSSLPVEKLLKKYGGVDVSFDLQPKSEDAKNFISGFLVDISNGSFEDLLSSLNAKVKNGQVTGYGNFEFLSPVFGKIKGDDKLDANTLKQLDYLNKFIGYIGNSVSPEIKQMILGILKKSLGVVVKKPKKDVSGTEGKTPEDILNIGKSAI